MAIGRAAETYMQTGDTTDPGRIKTASLIAASRAMRLRAREPGWRALIPVSFQVRCEPAYGTIAFALDMHVLKQEEGCGRSLQMPRQARLIAVSEVRSVSWSSPQRLGSCFIDG